MKQCLKIRVLGHIQDDAYRQGIQKKALTLDIEGTLQQQDPEEMIIYACGSSEHLDTLIDYLYKGGRLVQINDIIVEPFINEKDFRGVFRIIGD